MSPHPTGLRARDHCISSALIGGERRSWSKFALEGPTEGVSECEMDAKSTWIPTWHPMDMFRGRLGYSQGPPSEGCTVGGQKVGVFGFAVGKNSILPILKASRVIKN